MSWELRYLEFHPKTTLLFYVTIYLLPQIHLRWNSSWFWSPHTGSYSIPWVTNQNMDRWYTCNLVTCIQVWSCPVAELVKNSEIPSRTPIPFRIHSCSFIFTSVFQNHSNKTFHFYKWSHDSMTPPPFHSLFKITIKGKESWYLLVPKTDLWNIFFFPLPSCHSIREWTLAP